MTAAELALAQFDACEAIVESAIADKDPGFLRVAAVAAQGYHRAAREVLSSGHEHQVLEVGGRIAVQPVQVRPVAVVAQPAYQVFENQL